MSGGLAETRPSIAALKRAHPLALTVARYGIGYRRVSAGRYLAFCPFHDDRRTPNFSLYVDDPDDEHYKCYACGVRGDVLDFVRFKEGFGPGPEGFRATCAFLAGRPATPPDGPRLPAGEIPSAARDPRRERQWDRLTRDQQVAMNIAGEVYRAGLAQRPEARAYLRGRGLPRWLIARCGLGWADGASLARRLQGDANPRLLPAAEELGLLARRAGGGLRDWLAERLVVPEIRDGHVLWFIGRGLGPDGSTRHSAHKYLGLPGERPVLGLQWANRHREVFICEGVFDWLAALALDLPAFCALGTSVPRSGLGFLARARRIYGVFDTDRAGQDAAARFSRALDGRLHPLELPDGCKDLSDLLARPDGRVSFERLLAATRGAAYASWDRVPGAVSPAEGGADPGTLKDDDEAEDDEGEAGGDVGRRPPARRDLVGGGEGFPPTCDPAAASPAAPDGPSRQVALAGDD